jgi:hypothetical protein
MQPVTGMSANPGYGNWGELIGMKPEDLIAMALKRASDQGLEASPNDHRSVINMLRHDYTNYDGPVRNAVSDRLYGEILDAISRDFPSLAAQCERDKRTHGERVPMWVQSKRYAHQAGIERQRLGRQAVKNLSLGAKVIVNWRGPREAEIIEIRRSRVKARFSINGVVHVIDRPANEVSLIAGAPDEIAQM